MHGSEVRQELLEVASPSPQIFGRGLKDPGQGFQRGLSSARNLPRRPSSVKFLGVLDP